MTPRSPRARPALLLLAATGLAACTIQLVDQDPPAQATCGDGVLDAGEVCDDGNTVGGDGCAALCDSLELCGNGVLDIALGEECDPGNAGATATCDADCTLVMCGDGVRNPLAGEACDDGNVVSADGCRADCRSDETCGNGLRDDHLPKNRTSHPQECRSATAQGTGCAEVCDDGNTVAGDGCSANCLSEESCRNGILDPLGNGGSNPPEACDDGNQIDNDACSNTCRPSPTCGNGVVDAGEQCDAGTPGVDTAGCDRDCTLPVCGDNRVNGPAGELCDPGAVGQDTATCDNDCTPRVCGDGHVNPPGGEQCDPGQPGLDILTCDNDCTVALCGDGHRNVAAGEQCDDGNNVDTDACRNNCTQP